MKDERQDKKQRILTAEGADQADKRRRRRHYLFYKRPAFYVVRQVLFFCRLGVFF
jgi:hypothetical protein